MSEQPVRQETPTPSRYDQPINHEFQDVTPEQVARAIFAAAKKPDPRKQKQPAAHRWDSMELGEVNDG